MQDNRSPSNLVEAHYKRLAPDYDAEANATCEGRYREILNQHLTGCDSVLELGAGTAHLLEQLDCKRLVACDLSEDMLNRGKGRAERVRADAAKLPFADNSFDAVFSINLLEHVPNPPEVISESVRVLKSGGTWLAVTPNANWKLFLDLAERLRLKLPEGPHRFLSPIELHAEAAKQIKVTQHHTFVVFPIGSPRLSAFIDKIIVPEVWKGGFLQFLVGQK